jgi:hypothetical protein
MVRDRPSLHMKEKPRWLEQLLLRRPLNVVVAALANKMARVAWAVAHGRDYDPHWHSSKPAAPAAQPVWKGSTASLHICVCPRIPVA